MRWSQAIGGGYSGPAVAAGRVFVLDRVAPFIDPDEAQLLHDVAPDNSNFVRRLLPGKERVVCLNEADGAILWTHEYDCPYTVATTYANGPRATPAVDDGHVYTLGTEGHLVCLRIADKELIWSRDLKDDYEVETPVWGFASHPLVDGRLLYCMVGGKGATVVAFDKLTGDEVWKALDASEPGYAPPMISVFGGHRQLVVWDSENVSGLDLATGEANWQAPVEATYAMAIGLPPAAGNELFLTSFNRQSWLVRVAENGRSAKVAWYGTGRWRYEYSTRRRRLCLWMRTGRPLHLCSA
jgi:outer membrane protein assembly factor BamB